MHEDHTPTHGLVPLLWQAFDNFRKNLEAFVAANGYRPPPGGPLDPAIIKAVSRLTAREREYIAEACDVQGYTKEQIAERMHISTHTVDMHAREVFKALKVHCRSAMVRRAIQYGVIGIW